MYTRSILSGHVSHLQVFNSMQFINDQHDHPPLSYMHWSNYWSNFLFLVDVLQRANVQSVLHMFRRTAYCTHQLSSPIRHIAVQESFGNEYNQPSQSLGMNTICYCTNCYVLFSVDTYFTSQVMASIASIELQYTDGEKQLFTFLEL